MFDSQDRMFCDFCKGRIMEGQKHVDFKKYGHIGDEKEDYENYHRRFAGDCFDKQIKKDWKESKAS